MFPARTDRMRAFVGLAHPRDTGNPEWSANTRRGTSRTEERRKKCSTLAEFLKYAYYSYRYNSVARCPQGSLHCSSPRRFRSAISFSEKERLVTKAIATLSWGTAPKRNSRDTCPRSHWSDYRSPFLPGDTRGARAAPFVPSCARRLSFLRTRRRNVEKGRRRVLEIPWLEVCAGATTGIDRRRNEVTELSSDRSNDRRDVERLFPFVSCGVKSKHDRDRGS